MMLTESIFEIRELPFINDIKAKGGVIYSVGGAIRDSFLNKQSKDLDILITNIPIPELTAILQKYGKVDMVGVYF
ncbi:nucleotidyltransferase family protein, partial [Staphylococcus aureus]